MARKLIAIGHIPARNRSNIRKRVRVAWCNTCEADRILLDPQAWSGWPEGESPHTGTCIGCGSTVSVTSCRPSEGGAA